MGASRRKTSSDTENHGQEEKPEPNILSKLSNMFQQPKGNFDKPMNQEELNKNDDMSKTLANLLTMPTNKLEETMNNELNTHQSHINSEYFYLFYFCKRCVCFSLKTKPTLLLLKTLKTRKNLNFNYKTTLWAIFSEFFPRKTDEWKNKT